MVRPFQRPGIKRRIRKLIENGLGLAYDIESIYHEILDEVDWSLSENEIIEEVKEEIRYRGGMLETQEEVDMAQWYEKRIERLESQRDRLEAKLEKAYNLTGRNQLRQRIERLKVDLATAQARLKQYKAWRDDEKRKRALYHGDID